MASVANIVRFLPASGSTGDFVYSSGVTGYRTPVSSPALTDGATYRYRAESSDLSEWEIGEGTWTTSTTTLARTTIIHSSTGAKVNFTTAPNVAIVALADQFINPAGDTMTGSLVVPNASGLKIKDTDASHTLGLVGGSNLTADRTLTLTTGDANRTLTLTADSSVGGTAYVEGGTDVALADGGTGASLTDPNADRIMFWDDSAGAVTWLAPGAGLSINGTTIDASGMSAASQAEMEAASSTSVAVSPGRIVHDPTHLKAGIVFYWSISTHSTISSVNTTTDEVTTAGAHTLSTGDCVCCDYSGPGGWGNRVFYFARVVSSTVFTLHPTYTDAVNNTNKIDLTSAGSSTRNIYRFDATVLWSYRGAASAVITAKPGAAWNTAAVSGSAPGMGQVRFSFANALSSATAAFAQTSSLLGGSLDGGATWYKSGIFLRPSAVTATTYLDWDMTANYDSNVMLITTSGSSYVYVALVYGDE